MNLSLSERQSLLLLIKPELSGESGNSGGSALASMRGTSHSTSEGCPVETGCESATVTWELMEREVILLQSEGFPNDSVTSCT